jgi:hypothetical protein
MKAKEVLKILGISRQSLINYVKDGRIKVKAKLSKNFFEYDDDSIYELIGNMLYGNKTTPDMIASSIEIARRGFKKYTKGWFYPNVDNLDEQWKQTLNYSESTTWKELFNKIKNLKLKYRVQLNEIIQNAVFSKFYIKRNYSVYQFN